MKRLLPFVPISAILLLICLTEVFRPQPLDWTPSFSASDKIPWGTYILHDLIRDLFPGDSIHVSDETLFMALNREDTTVSGENLLIINESFRPDPLDLKTLLNFVEDGNNVFISASWLSRELSDTLGIKLGTNFAQFDTTMCIQPEDSSRHAFKTAGFQSYVESYDTSSGEVLAYDKEKHPLFLKISRDDGSIFVHLVPWIFTNYNLLKRDNASYAATVLTHLPQGPLMWDEYYKGARYGSQTPISFVLNNPALRWAYYTMLLGIFVFILVEGKRKQRKIPVFTPVRNETLSFVGTLARLYYRQNHHRHVALQMRYHFLEFIRTKYHLSTGSLTGAFPELVSRKAGYPASEMRLLVNELSTLDAPVDLNDDELMKLNRLLESFYAKCR